MFKFFREKNLPAFIQEVNSSHLLSNGDIREGVRRQWAQAFIGRLLVNTVTSAPLLYLPTRSQLGEVAMAEDSLYHCIFAPWVANSSSLIFPTCKSN